MSPEARAPYWHGMWVISRQFHVQAQFSKSLYSLDSSDLLIVNETSTLVFKRQGSFVKVELRPTDMGCEET